MHDQLINDLMESTLKPRAAVIAALKQFDWNGEEAFMLLAKELLEPTIYKY